MGELKRYEFYVTLRSWGLGIHLSYEMDCFAIAFGPLNFQFNWDVK